MLTGEQTASSLVSTDGPANTCGDISHSNHRRTLCSGKSQGQTEVGSSQRGGYRAGRCKALPSFWRLLCVIGPTLLRVTLLEPVPRHSRENCFFYKSNCTSQKLWAARDRTCPSLLVRVRSFTSLKMYCYYYYYCGYYTAVVIGVSVCAGAPVEVREELSGINSLLLPCGGRSLLVLLFCVYQPPAFQLPDASISASTSHPSHLGIRNPI